MLPGFKEYLLRQPLSVAISRRKTRDGEKGSENRGQKNTGSMKLVFEHCFLWGFFFNNKSERQGPEHGSKCGPLGLVVI